MPLRHTVDFLLYDWLKVQHLQSRARFADHSRETFDAVLDTCERIARDKFAPFNRLVDTQEPHFDGEKVVMRVVDSRRATVQLDGQPLPGGVVRGIVVRSLNLGQGVVGGLKQIFGGNIGEYIKVCEEARHAATQERRDALYGELAKELDAGTWDGDRDNLTDQPEAMDWAAVAAERGHRVTIVEASGKLGGQFRLDGEDVADLAIKGLGPDMLVVGGADDECVALLALREVQFRVAPGQIIIYGYDMHAFPCQGIQICG